MEITLAAAREGKIVSVPQPGHLQIAVHCERYCSSEEYLPLARRLGSALYGHSSSTGSDGRTRRQSARGAMSVIPDRHSRELCSADADHSSATRRGEVCQGYASRIGSHVVQRTK